ncbi:MAG: RidA family protein [Phycisphaerae bacterium]|nr:RidA family protein [Phycisphaerae bacterium]
MTPQERLAQLGIVLPVAPAPIGVYVPSTRVGNIVYTSGQLPMRDGRLIATGKVGQDLSIDEAAAAARVAALNALAQVAQIARSINRVRRIVRLGVFVNSATGFIDQPKVANGASQLMIEIFGDAGQHVRSAVGNNELPLNAAVEVEMIAEIET